MNETMVKESPESTIKNSEPRGFENRNEIRSIVRQNIDIPMGATMIVKDLFRNHYRINIWTKKENENCVMPVMEIHSSYFVLIENTPDGPSFTDLTK